MGTVDIIIIIIIVQINQSILTKRHHYEQITYK